MKIKNRDVYHVLIYILISILIEFAGSLGRTWTADPYIISVVL